MAGCHFDHRVIDAPALTNWKLGEVARSAIENAERLVLDCKAGLDDGPRAGACRGTLPTHSYAGRLRTGEPSALGPLVDVGMWEQSRGAGRYIRRHRGSVGLVGARGRAPTLSSCSWESSVRSIRAGLTRDPTGRDG